MMQSISETGRYVTVIERKEKFVLLGEFSLKGKIRYAIKMNLIFYGSLLLIFVIIIIYVAAKGGFAQGGFAVKLIESF